MSANLLSSILVSVELPLSGFILSLKWRHKLLPRKSRKSVSNVMEFYIWGEPVNFGRYVRMTGVDIHLFTPSLAQFMCSKCYFWVHEPVIPIGECSYFISINTCRMRENCC